MATISTPGAAEIGPGAELLRVPRARDDRDDRRRGGRAVRQASLPPGPHQPRVDERGHQGLEVRGVDVRLEAADDRAGLGAGRAVRLLEPDLLAGLLPPRLLELRDDLREERLRDGVRDERQLDRAGGRRGRPGHRRMERERGEQRGECGAERREGHGRLRDDGTTSCIPDRRPLQARVPSYGAYPASVIADEAAFTAPARAPGAAAGRRGARTTPPSTRRGCARPVARRSGCRASRSGA